MDEAFQSQSAFDAAADGFACDGSRLRVRAGVALSDVACAEQRRVAHLAAEDAGAGDEVAVAVLRIDAPEVDRNREAVGRGLVGIRF